MNVLCCIYVVTQCNSYMCALWVRLHVSLSGLDVLLDNRLYLFSLLMPHSFSTFLHEINICHRGHLGNEMGSYIFPCDIVNNKLYFSVTIVLILWSDQMCQQIHHFCYLDTFLKLIHWVNKFSTSVIMIRIFLFWAYTLYIFACNSLRHACMNTKIG